MFPISFRLLSAAADVVNVAAETSAKDLKELCSRFTTTLPEFYKTKALVS